VSGFGIARPLNGKEIISLRFGLLRVASKPYEKTLRPLERSGTEHLLVAFGRKRKVLVFGNWEMSRLEWLNTSRLGKGRVALDTVWERRNLRWTLAALTVALSWFVPVQREKGGT